MNAHRTVHAQIHMGHILASVIVVTQIKARAELELAQFAEVHI